MIDSDFWEAELIIANNSLAVRTNWLLYWETTFQLLKTVSMCSRVIEI